MFKSKISKIVVVFYILAILIKIVSFNQTMDKSNLITELIVLSLVVGLVLYSISNKAE